MGSGRRETCYRNPEWPILKEMPLLSRDSELVQIMDAALADATRRAGHWLACHIGCTQCCHGAFAINALDTERLRRGMDVIRAADSALADELERRARAWITAYGSEFPGDLKTGILGTSSRDQAKFDHFADHAACPALDPVTGRCDVYPWRPMTCRAFGPPVRVGEGDEFACCELCFVGASVEQIMACEMQVPHNREADLLAETGDKNETVVAFALVPEEYRGQQYRGAR
jgi:Fe-S-cluster containining protein